MIGKLKRKFTILATVSMLVLMTVLVLIMNIVNYTSVVKESDTVLDVLSQPNAPFLDNMMEHEKPTFQADEFIPRDMSPEVPYESRYFTAIVSEDGEIKESNLSQIISVDDSSAEEYIKKAMSSSGERGFVGQFRYLKQTDDVYTKIMFLDCGRKIDAFYSFLWTSIIVGLFGCIIVFVTFLLCSGKIVKPINEAYEKQKRFISDAGHEIKTPLTIINANVDLLECDGEKEELTEIKTQVVRLTELTNNLVCLSKMEESEHKIQRIPVPLSDIVNETAGSFEKLALSENIKLTCRVQDGITVNASPDSMRRLISILLENAVKYTGNGGIISLDMCSGKKTAVITVFNTTKEYIDKESLPHVFDRFYRMDMSRNSASGGHGIGLSIAQAIVNEHGGTIGVATANGYDFSVKIELPMQ